MYFSNGNRYEGEWKNNLIEGYGILYFSNGNRYEGEWKNCKSEGYGIIYFFNGDRYEGQFKNGKSEGYGIFYSSLGFKYKSYFKINILFKILFIIYKILLFFHFLYSTFKRNKITFILIITLILSILIN